MDLSDKVAVVTGASSGLGEAGAKALADRGMTVVAVARRAERLDALAASHPRVHAYPADVTSDAQVAGLAHWVEQEFAACHVLVNSAGASSAGRFRGPEDVEAVRTLMDLNFMGTVRCMAAFAGLLFASAPSRVVNIGSVAGKIGVNPPAYPASKFATVGFTEAVAHDWHRKGVAVSQLNPGFVVTEGFPQTDLLKLPFAKRWIGRPEQVAAALVDVAEKGTFERTVPRWYRPMVVGRHVVPMAYRLAMRWMRV